MPEDVQYVCRSCRNEENPEWLESVRQEIQAGYVYVCQVFSCSCFKRMFNYEKLHDETGDRV